MYIYHFHTLDQRDFYQCSYIICINLWLGIIMMSLNISWYIPNHRDTSRYILDHQIFDGKAAIYIASTNSLSIVGFNYEVLLLFEGLLKPITSDKRS